MENAYKWFVGVVLAVLLLLSLNSSFNDNKTYPTADDIASKIVLPTPEPVVVPNLSNEKLDAVYNKVLEDDAWENLAEDLATEEWTDRDYKDLFKAIEDIYEDIDDEDDIVYVKEDESTDFEDMDSDEGDGTVIQYLKVKYEDKDGDDKKVYLTVETEFDEGDLEEQDFSETD